MIPTGIPTQGMMKRKMIPTNTSAKPRPIIPAAFPRDEAFAQLSM
jgi:hypothetical protein